MVQGNGAVGREGRTLGDIQAHAVTLSDSSELSYAGSVISGSSQTLVRRTASIPEEPKVCISKDNCCAHAHCTNRNTM